MRRSRLALKFLGMIKDGQTLRATLADLGYLNWLQRYEFSKSATLAKKWLFFVNFREIKGNKGSLLGPYSTYGAY